MMRIVLVLALAMLVLPLSGCAKKKKDDSTATASNDQSDAGQDHGDGGMAMQPFDEGDMGDGDDMGDDYDMGDDGGGGHGDGGMSDDYADDGDMTDDDMFADAGDSQNRRAFDESDGDDGGHGDDGDMPEDMPDEFDGAGGKFPGGPGRFKSSKGGGHGDDGDMPEDMPDEFDDEGDGPKGGPGRFKSSKGGGHGDGDEGDMPGDMPDEGDMPGDMPDDGDNPDGPGPGQYDAPGEGGRFDGEGGGGAAQKPTDIPGVEEGTAEYAAVDLILKVANGKTEDLSSLIAEDATGLLKELRGANAKKSLAEAKALMGRVVPQNSRLGDRETIVSFKNDKNKILQFHVRKIQGKYVVRELRVREAARTSKRGRR